MVSKDFIEELKSFLSEAEKVLEDSHAEAKQNRREAHQFKDNHRASWHQAETSSFMALTSVRMATMFLNLMIEDMTEEENSEIKFRDLKTDK